MKVSIYIANKKYKASSYYRIVQYIDDMDIECKAHVYEFFPNWYYETIRNIKFKVLKLCLTWFMYFLGYTFRGISILKSIISKDEEIVFIQGEIFFKRVPLIFRRLLKKYLKKVNKIIWDFDKDILKSKEISLYEFNILKDTSNLITVSHEALVNILGDDINYKVKVLKTTDKILEYVNLYEINKERLSYYNNKIILLWIGKSNELNNLKKILPNLESLAKKLKYQELVLKVVCNKRLEDRVDYLIVENIKFTKKNVFNEMLKSHIAIVCLENLYELNEKIYINLIQYIGVGLPIVTSQNSIAEDFIKNNNGYLAKEGIDFEKSILYLTEKSIWKNKSNLSRKLWEDEFDSYGIKNILEGTLKL